MIYTCTSCHFSNIMELRKKYQDPFVKQHGVKLSFMSAFVKASAYALQDQPVCNAVIDDLEIVYRDYVDISVAVSTPKVSYDTGCYTMKIVVRLCNRIMNVAGSWSNLRALSALCLQEDQLSIKQCSV